jgi:carbamoyl-phosphate synthase/aspartate carbamoyltransferase/dihydroorotase
MGVIESFHFDKFFLFFYHSIIDPPLVNASTFEKVDLLASASSYVDYGLYAGATSENASLWPSSDFIRRCAGLKMYLNTTFGTLKLDQVSDWIQHFQKFPRDKPIVCHAERQTLAAVLAVAQLAGRSVHICHVARRDEIELIVQAKERGWPVTCEVAPHHLLLKADQLPMGWREVRPELSQTDDDVQALWSNLKYIDCFATDHGRFSLFYFKTITLYTTKKAYFSSSHEKRKIARRKGSTWISVYRIHASTVINRCP